jgi:pyruvate dehydrogenase E1 component alpha subunit
MAKAAAKKPLLDMEGDPALGLFQIVAPDGKIVRPDLFKELGLSDELLLRFYTQMVFNRKVEERFIMLQRQGRISFYIGLGGEEAAVIGSTAALNPDDLILPDYRSSAALFWRGMSLQPFVDQQFGTAADPTKGRQMPCHLSSKEHHFVSISSCLATEIPNAVGAAWAFKIRKTGQVAIAYFGDGCTSEGDFHVGINFAGVFKAPAILLCRNNQWAISTPVSRQSATETFAQKGAAYGVEGVRIDGNDIIGVYYATKKAAEKARRGDGATLIEAVTYRIGAHSTSDDPRMYRKEDEVKPWREKDPILRLRKVLESKKLWTEKQEEELLADCAAQVQAAIKQSEATPMPALPTLMDDLFAEPTPRMRKQLAEVEHYIAEHGPLNHGH